MLLLAFTLFNYARADGTENDAHSSLQAAAPEAVLIQETYFKLKRLRSTSDKGEYDSNVFRNISETECSNTRLNTNQCPLVTNQRYPLYDGSCNNRLDISRGQAFRPLKRLLPAKYADDVELVRESVTDGSPLPSARHVANILHGANKAEKAPVSDLSHMFTQWGQFIIHDIVHTPVIKGENGTDLDCNCESPHPECLNIEIAKDDKQYSENKTCFSLPRSLPTPNRHCSVKGAREQINQISSYIDGTTVYGIDANLLHEIRDPDSEAGELKISTKYNGSSHGDHLPNIDQMDKDNTLGKPFACPMKLNRNKETCFFAGDKRINENAGLTAMHTIFMREHNRIARELKRNNPHWNADTVFDETRLIIAAINQVITYNEYLPALLGPVFVKRYGLAMARSGYFYGYDATVDASVTNEFTTAAFRFGHSMINDKLSRPSADWSTEDSPIKMKDALFNPESFLNGTHSSVNPILRGLCSDMSLKADTTFPESMKDFLFAKKDQFGKDLFAINIQRGRDHGLSGYNDYREFFGMQRARNFDELLEIPSAMREHFRDVYNHVDDIDIYAGGLAERSVEGGAVGATFAHMMGAQFRDLKFGDRFYFENGGCETIFTPEQVNELRKVTLSSLICTCTDTNTVQRDPFRHHNDIDNATNPSRNAAKPNPRVPCNEVYKLDLSAWREPYINSEELMGYQDTGSWTAWLPALGKPKTLALDVLHRERPLGTCLNTIKQQIRFVREDRNLPQIRFMCPAGILQEQDFPPACLERGRWTPWFDHGNPLSDHGFDDIETFRDVQRARPNELCDEPLFIQGQTIAGIPAGESGDVFETFDARRGLVCRGEHQESGQCQDYRVRFFCAIDTVKDKVFSQMMQLSLDEDIDLDAHTWTSWFSADEPDSTDGTGDFEYLTKARYLNPEICVTPLAIDAVTVDGEIDALSTGDVFRYYSRNKGLVCANGDQTHKKCADYQVRYLCKKPVLISASAAAVVTFNDITPETSEEPYEPGAPYQETMSTVKEGTAIPASAIANARVLCHEHDLCCVDADYFHVDFVRDYINMDP